MISTHRILLFLFIALLFLTTVFGGKEDKDDSSAELTINKKNSEYLTGSQTQSNDLNKTQPKISFGFFHAFIASLSVIVVSEIGDKTFFIAAIMAMKHPRLTVYLGAMFALGLMTILSALLGNILTQFIPKIYTYYASTFLFFIFGLKMLHEGYNMESNDATEEYEEANSTLKETEEKNENEGDNKDLEAGQTSVSSTQKFIKTFRKYISAVFLQAFVLTFLAEWGDRSQISTIILGARENIFGTAIGGTLGHGLCTGVAVIGGRLIAQKISVRTVTLIGAAVFLFFAVSAFFISPDDI